MNNIEIGLQQKLIVERLNDNEMLGILNNSNETVFITINGTLVASVKEDETLIIHPSQYFFFEKIEVSIRPKDKTKKVTIIYDVEQKPVNKYE
jgi:hypothetical protein